MTTAHSEPCHDIAHLAHVEIYTDKFEESLAFFVDVYGLTVSARDHDHAWLRAWDDYEFHTLIPNSTCCLRRWNRNGRS